LVYLDINIFLLLKKYDPIHGKLDLDKIKIHMLRPANQTFSIKFLRNRIVQNFHGTPFKPKIPFFFKEKIMVNEILPPI
jgi:hypothetical protein